MKKLAILLALPLLLSLPFFSASAQAEDDIGIGPVKELTLGAIDPKLAAKGKALFASKCSACHKIEERYVGPALRDVTKRRRPEWIMNMALNPIQMTQENETAKALFGEYLVQMTFQNVTKDEVRAILEYFRQSDSQPAKPAATPNKK